MPSGYLLDTSDGTKTCPRCGVVKPLSDYNKSRNSVHGVVTYCKGCCSEMQAVIRNDPQKRERARLVAQQWRRDNLERAKDHSSFRHYKLPYGAYAEMLAAQNSKCAICGTDSPGGKGRFHIDHSHATGAVRGLLCHNCNVLLGHSKEDPSILESALRYLRSF